MSDDSLDDLFAKTQSNPIMSDAWKDGMVDYPKLIFFKWAGNVDDPFEIVETMDLDAIDVDPNWLSGVLSPKSRTKCRHLSFYKDYAVSLFAKIGKSMFEAS